MLKIPSGKTQLKIPSGKTHLSARDAATYSDVHINTIRRWIRAGKIAATRIGSHGHYTIPIAELNQALKYEMDSTSAATEA